MKFIKDVPLNQPDIFLGTVTVVDSAPAGRPNPYLGRIRSGNPSGSQSNPSLGEVVIVDSALIASDPYLGTVKKN